MTGKKRDREKQEQDLAESSEIAEASGDQKKEALSVEAEIARLEQSLAEERAIAEKNLEGWRRAEADFSNYRRRSDLEKNEMNHNTTCSVVYNILPVMDDLDRALASIPAEYADLPWVEGVQLIYKKLRSILESMGLEEVCAVGKAFDPNLHEAVAHMEGEEGAVIEELQKGYKIKDKLIRPSRVVVGKGLGNSRENNSSQIA